MSVELINTLLMDEELLIYLRMHPQWIKMLTRDPGLDNDFIQSFRIETKKTFGDKMEQIGQYVTLANMFFQV